MKKLAHIHSDKGKPMQIGELARKAGMSVRTIRFYEELGLLQPEGHSAGGFRLYESETLIRLQVIHFLKELGMTLTEIGAILHAKKPEGADKETVKNLKAAFKDKLLLVDQKCRDLRKIGLELSQALKLLESCERCDHKVLLNLAGCGDCADLKTMAAVPKTLEVILR
jgi:DNA-binding transcriptional MerR regulator